MHVFWSHKGACGATKKAGTKLQKNFLQVCLYVCYKQIFGIFIFHESGQLRLSGTEIPDIIKIITVYYIYSWLSIISIYTLMVWATASWTWPGWDFQVPRPRKACTYLSIYSSIYLSIPWWHELQQPEPGQVGTSMCPDQGWAS